MDRDCGSSVAGEEEGGSAPPLFQLLNQFNILTQYIMTLGNWNGLGHNLVKENV